MGDMGLRWDLYAAQAYGINNTASSDCYTAWTWDAALESRSIFRRWLLIFAKMQVCSLPENCTWDVCVAILRTQNTDMSPYEANSFGHKFPFS